MLMSQLPAAQVCAAMMPAVNTKQSHYTLAIKALKGINFDDKELG